MSTTKVNADVLDLTDDYAFTGTVTGAGGGWKLISTGTASGSATLAFTGFNSTLYSSYKFLVENINPATDAQDLWMRTSTDGGSSYDDGASDYDWASCECQAGQILSRGDAADSHLDITTNAGTGNAATEGLSSAVHLFRPDDAALVTMVTWHTTFKSNGGGILVQQGGGYRNAATDVDAVQFKMSSGNMDTGTIQFLGMVK